MSHYTRFIIKHKDGFTEAYVGNPQSSREKAEHERLRLVIDDGYKADELEIVEVPN